MVLFWDSVCIPRCATLCALCSCVFCIVFSAVCLVSSALCCPCCVYFVCDMCGTGALLLVEYTVLCVFHGVVSYVWCWHL